MWILGEWWWWFAFWLLPLVTWFQLVVRIRSMAEHAATDFSDNELQNVRTTYANPIIRLFLAPYWVNYHVEHHLFMYVPCWKLKQTHNALRENDYVNRMETAAGYIDVLIKACSKKDDEENHDNFISNPKQRLKGYFSEGFRSSQSMNN